MTNDVPKDVKPFIDEISSSLWTNRAAVMVGAGFSKNAQPIGSSASSFPDWKALGDLLYRKLHGKLPTENARYLSVLKLADQIQAAFGRPTLDRTLIHAIPDLQFEPSQLHRDLLNLPWVDVFTTNYDTLLERARVSVTLKHYQVVTRKDDLLQATGRRILKLHGSFPSPPFIISEEDYRTYPSEHAPFVNTVRQALLERTLVLIGFSGDDPNFLQWIGWLRDQIGTGTVPYIYMIGVFARLSEADRKLFNSRNIVPVDLSDISKDPSQALRHFFAYLEECKPRSLQWPTRNMSIESHPGSDDISNLVEISKEWRRQRLRYPGWVVMPSDQRRSLWLRTIHSFTKISQLTSEDRSKLDPPDHLGLVFELGWRLDRCLFPLSGDIVEMLEEIVTEYAGSKVTFSNDSYWNTSTVDDAITNIRLWLMRYYREQSLLQEWTITRAAMSQHVEELTPQTQAKLQLEDAHHSLYRFDLNEAKRKLVEWQPNDNLPFWEAQRAGLMAELGEMTSARSILESSLSTIRRQQSLSPVSQDYTLLSQESIVMLLLWIVDQAMSAAEPDVENSELLKNMDDRWTELAKYKCDPRNELGIFRSGPTRQLEVRENETTTHRYDLGRVTKTTHFGFDTDSIAAFEMLRMYDELGLPLRIANWPMAVNDLEAALPVVGRYSPHLALVSLIRLGDGNAADWLINRKFVADLTQEDADHYFEVCLPMFDRSLVEINRSEFSEIRYFLESLASTMPEVLSRLCSKCSPTSRDRLLKTLIEIYRSTNRRVFTNFRVLPERLFFSMPIEERVRAVPKLIDLPIPDQLSDFEKMDYFNPLQLVSLEAEDRRELIEVSNEKIEKLLDQLHDGELDRDWIRTSLVWLNQYGKLTGPQSERLAGYLWEGVEPPELPTISGFRKHVLTRLVCVAESDPERRLKEHFIAELDEKADDSRLDELLEELRQSAVGVNWQVVDIIRLINQASTWWEKHKLHLTWDVPTLFGSPAQQVRNTIWQFASALAEILGRASPFNDKELVRLVCEFIANLNDHEIPCTRLEVPISENLDTDPKALIDRIAAMSMSSKEEHVRDALISARLLASLLKDLPTRHEYNHLASVLAHGVEWRSSIALFERMIGLADLVANHSWAITKEVEASMLRGLEHTADETREGIKGNDEGGLISVRVAAAKLAFELFKLNEKLGTGNSDILFRWQAICDDPNEFAEIRNAWPSFLA